MKRIYTNCLKNRGLGAAVTLMPVILRRWMIIASSILLFPFTVSSQGQGNGQGQGQPETVLGTYNIDGGYIVDFVNYEHDFDNCKTYFYYQVYNNNTNPEISHFNFGASSCNATCLDELPDGSYGSWYYQGNNIILLPGDGTIELGSDPSSGMCGIKFDEELRNDESMKVYLAVDGIQHPGLLDFAVKASTNTTIVSIPGPISCSGSCEGLNFYKTASQDTIMAGDTVTYTFTIDKIWTDEINGHIKFEDILEDGMEWVSEPMNLSDGVVLGPTSIMGNSVNDTADFRILSLPVGISSFEIKAITPNPYSGSNPYMNQAWLTRLPAFLVNAKPSDYPVTPEIGDPTPLVILAETDCSANWNIPILSAEFKFNHKSVDVTSNIEIVNVVLEFEDGSHQMFAHVNDFDRKFQGTHTNHGKCITGVWIRTECNASGDGPGYGDYIESPIWDGECGNNGVTVIDVTSNHGSTVLNGNGPTLIGWHGPRGHHRNQNTVPSDNTAASNATESQDFSGWEKVINPESTEISVYPNPARSNATINVNGLGTTAWTVHIYSMDGKYISAQVVYPYSGMDIASLNLDSGMYFLEFENGVERKSARLILQE